MRASPCLSFITLAEIPGWSISRFFVTTCPIAQSLSLKRLLKWVSLLWVWWRYRLSTTNKHTPILSLMRYLYHDILFFSFSSLIYFHFHYVLNAFYILFYPIILFCREKNGQRSPSSRTLVNSAWWSWRTTWLPSWVAVPMMLLVRCFFPGSFCHSHIYTHTLSLYLYFSLSLFLSLSSTQKKMLTSISLRNHRG